MSVFYLGAHQPHWLWQTAFPLFVSHRALTRRRSLRPGSCRWALDSGGFTELSLHGRWITPPEDYAAAVTRYAGQIGGLDFAAPQDWMCEPVMLARTGLPVAEHQHRTVANYLALRQLAPLAAVHPGGAGLAAAPTTWPASTCTPRPGSTWPRCPGSGSGRYAAASPPPRSPSSSPPWPRRGLRLHGFGIKTTGLGQYGHLLASADSMAWSYAARRAPALPGCTGHRNCANCLTYATTLAQPHPGRYQPAAGNPPCSTPHHPGRWPHDHDHHLADR